LVSRISVINFRWKFPDDATVATLVRRIVALGNVKSTTLKAFQKDAFRMIIDAV